WRLVPGTPTRALWVLEPSKTFTRSSRAPGARVSIAIKVAASVEGLFADGGGDDGARADAAGKAGGPSTANGPRTTTRQLRSCRPHSAKAGVTAACSEAAPRMTPGWPPAPTATAFQPRGALPSRRPTSSRISGATALMPLGAKPTTFSAVG